MIRRALLVVLATLLGAVISNASCVREVVLDLDAAGSGSADVIPQPDASMLADGALTDGSGSAAPDAPHD